MKDTQTNAVVPATGQVRCYDASGREIPCHGTGQDGESRCGLTWGQPRFELLGEMVADRLTGLVWTRRVNFAEFPLTWSEALAFVQDMNRKRWQGFADWRLPNRRELRSVLSLQDARPALPAGHPFIEVFFGWYWTSTTAAISPAHAWYLQIEGARMFYGGKDQSFLVWPVRCTPTAGVLATGQTRCFDARGDRIDCRGTGQDGEYRTGLPWPARRFEPAGQCVLDRLTGLCWHPCADLAGRPVDWEGALAAVAALDPGGGPPWRLPNINELESLVDASRAGPALPPGAPFEQVREAYWSSTTSAYEPDWAWALYLDKGAVGVGQKRGPHFHVWAVRCQKSDLRHQTSGS